MTLADALEEHNELYTIQTGVTVALTALRYYKRGLIGPSSFVEAIKEIVGTNTEIPAAVFEELLSHYKE